MSQYSRVLAMIDWSPLRYKTVVRAVSIASRNGSELFIGHIVDIEPYIHSGCDFSELRNDTKERIEKDLCHILDRAGEESSIPYIKINVIMGYIPQSLNDLIDLVCPDLIVCGNRGLSSLQYLFLGSVSAHLAKTSKCDLLVVKEGCV